MSIDLSLSRSMRTQKARQKSTSLFWIYSWALASSIPLLPYTTPLWSGALADTPFAYLVWIPVFAFTWAGWTLRRALSYNDDPELNGIMGLPLLALTASLLIAGMTTWQYYFVGQSVGLLVWPFWALGLAWLMFGVGVTRHVIRPLAYLLLTWPPLYNDIINVTNPILLEFANRFVGILSQHFSWLLVVTASGTYVIRYGIHAITVYVTSVCSGADSLLAVVILFPIILVSFTGSLLKKAVAIIVAVILALIANWLRLAILIFSIHSIGPTFSLNILHPMLGILLFVAMVFILVNFCKWMGLDNKRFQKGMYLRKPGMIRFCASVFMSLLVTISLMPLYQTSLGTTGTPLVVKTDLLSSLMPQLRGWTRTLVGQYDASSLLGAGAKSTAYAYTSIFGDYALTEWWWTYQPIALAGYSEHNCLLFHGSQIISKQTMSIRNGISATVFGVLLPPKQVSGPQNLFIDTVYTFTAKYRGRNAYIRSEIATPVALNVIQQSSLVRALPSMLKQLIADTYIKGSSLAPLPLDATIHVENYFTFVHQISDQVLTKSVPQNTLSKA